MRLFSKFSAFLLLLVFCSPYCSQQPINPDQVEHKPLLIKNVYISEEFTPQQARNIEDGIYEWQYSTLNSIQFNLIEHYNQNLKSLIDPNVSVIILKKEEQDPFIQEIDRQLKEEYSPTAFDLGYFNDEIVIPEIYLVSSRMSQNEDLMIAVTAHEIGHELGLQHNPHFNSLMYYQVNDTKFVTDEDVVNYCKIYLCYKK